MPQLSIATVLQAILGLGLLNVWLIRSNWATGFRGGEAKSLREEFAVYGLPDWSFFAIGALKIGSAVALLAGLWFPQLVLPAAGVVIALMVGAVAMHIKVSDPLARYVPALAMLAMSATLAVLVG